VRAELRGRGIGRRLFDALAAWGARHGAAEVHTAWPTGGDTDAAAGSMPPGLRTRAHHVIDCAVDGGLARRTTTAAGAGVRRRPAREIDYGRPEGNDHERLARDLVDVRAMTPADLDAIVRIDRDITGQTGATTSPRGWPRRWTTPRSASR
jgi:hypothetical protein